MTQDNIQIVEVESFPVVVVRDVVSTMKIGKVMGPAYHAIKAYLNQEGVTPLDDEYPFCIYRDVTFDHLDAKGFIATLKMMFAEKWNIEMGIPSQKPLSGTETLIATNFPAGKYLQTVHMGPYRFLRQTYKRLADYANAEGIPLGTVSVEKYTNSPGSVPDDALKTIVLVSVS
ncbi:MAG: GyrI-like domain-containing protein [Deltaproteobacteria bacterium]|nr:GyrI-like domain-containing protein [Deltaproteobacteria bacterium]MBN2671045.1 GyrI-like domain-containing protein [Deltaproteobacteria bacterium]